MVFALTTFTILPEGLAAGWAALFHADPAARGFDQGLIMAAGPVGFVVGGLIVGRLVRPVPPRRAGQAVRRAGAARAGADHVGAERRDRGGLWPSPGSPRAG